jgi:inner membrane protein
VAAFSAEWVVHELARTLPDNWLTGAAAVELSESFAWISLFQPVTEYTIVDRAIKYGLLFIALTFLGFLCFELRTALRFHPVQYGVVGMGLVLFYLALLSLSEHLAFGPSYLAMTADVRLSGWMAVIVAGLYSTLYVLLQLEAFALLVGTAVLFIGLGALMAATRSLTGRNTESVSADGG